MRLSSWFPKPETPADIEDFDAGGGGSRQRLFDLLHDRDALELREKVGVVTPADGSARATTRLLKSGRWILKTDVYLWTPEKAALLEKLAHLREIARQIPLWHPDKSWFLLRRGEEWLPVSICPYLSTIRNFQAWNQQMQWWSRMIAFGLEISSGYGVGLDLNPSNFAVEDPASARLYYLDDEIYSQHDCFDIAEVIVARIPENPDISPQQWRQWGYRINMVVQPFCQSHEQQRAFLEGIQHYPLPPALEPRRHALLEGIHQKQPPESKPLLIHPPSAPASSAAQPATASPEEPEAQVSPTQPIPRTSPAPRLSCIFADVHGNLPALETVFQESQKLGVDEYIFLGDIVSYGPFPKQCITMLASLEPRVSVRGNHDHTVATGIPENGSNRMAREVDMWTVGQLRQEERDWLLALPVEYGADGWMVVHGAPIDPHHFYAYVYEMTYQDNLAYLEEHQCAVCFYGHTHVPFIHRRLADGKDEKLAPQRVTVFRPGERLLINPGSVGQPRDGDPRAAFALWDHSTNEITFHRIPYPVDRTVEAVKKAGLPEDLVYRLEVGR